MERVGWWWKSGIVLLTVLLVVTAPLVGGSQLQEADGNATGGNLEWATIEKAGYVHTSPTIVNGTAYVGTRGASNTDYTNASVFAVDTETGEVEWRFSEPLEEVLSAPMVVDGTVYFGDNEGTLYAVDAATGEKEWETTTPNKTINGSPMVVGGTVYIGSEGTWEDDRTDASLYAFNATTGSQQWTFTKPTDSVESSPLVVNGTVYAGSDDGTLYAVNAATGEQEWAFDKPADRVFSSPTFASGTVYVGAGDGTLYAVDAATGDGSWEFNTTGAIYSSPTVSEGTVFVGSTDESLYAVNSTTGSEEWVFSKPDGKVNPSPTVANGRVFVGAEDRVLYSVNTTTGEEVWSFSNTSGSIESSPMVADGTVYFGANGESSDYYTDPAFYAVDAGVNGSSEGSRAQFGTLGHHDEWRHKVAVSYNVNTTTADPGEDVAVTATITNNGATESTETVTFTADDEPFNEVPVTIGAGNSTTVSATTSFSTVGTHKLSVNSHPATAIEIGSPAELAVTYRVNETELAPGGDTNVTATVENTGDQTGTTAVEFYADGEQFKNQSVTVPGGETATTSAVANFSTAGTHEVSVNSRPPTTINVESPAALAVSYSVNQTELAPGEDTNVTATINNTGDQAGTTAVGFYADGSQFENESVTVAGGATATTSAVTNFSTSGTHLLSVNNLEETTVNVTAPADVAVVDYTVSSTEPRVNSSVNVSATVTNTGGTAGTMNVSFYVDSSMFAKRSVTVGAGENTTIEASTSFETTGQHTVAVGDQQPTTLNVTMPPSIAVTNLSVPATVNVNESVPVNATIAPPENTTQENVTLSFYKDGEAAGTKTIDSMNATRHVTFWTSFSEAGETHTVTVNDAEPVDVYVRTEAVFEVTYTVNKTNVTVGEDVKIAATVENTGETAGSTMVNISVDNSTVESQSISLNENETATVTTTTEFVKPDKHVVSVNNGTETTISVTESQGPGDITGDGNAAADPDGDGVYEDVNGDGTVNVLDVQALFINLDNEAVARNPELFDYNDSGSVNVVDIQRLFEEL